MTYPPNYGPPISQSVQDAEIARGSVAALGSG
jgi:hypothetical protein